MRPSLRSCYRDEKEARRANAQAGLERWDHSRKDERLRCCAFRELTKAQRGFGSCALSKRPAGGGRQALVERHLGGRDVTPPHEPCSPFFCSRWGKILALGMWAAGKPAATGWKRQVRCLERG